MADFHSFDSRTFQSTLPARGATEAIRQQRTSRTISIHAPRTGSDLEGRKKKGVTQDISIHAPRTGSDSAGGRISHFP